MTLAVLIIAFLIYQLSHEGSALRSIK